MAYRVTIDTDKYIDRKCSQSNWEPGTMNDFMHAINGWSSRENSLEEVRWRIEYIGNWFSNVKEEDREKYRIWHDKKKNKITFYDKLCELERIEPVRMYGFCQGYFDVEKVIAELKENGRVVIPFKRFYDMRQYIKNMNGCAVIIEKI